MLFWLKKKGNFNIKYNMDEYYPKWNKPERQIVCDFTSLRYLE